MDRLDDYTHMPTNTVCQTDDIYNEEFINQFYQSLDQLQKIQFKVYYYDGIDNQADFAKHFGVCKTSAYWDIRRLKAQLKKYIIKNKIH